MQKTIEVVYEKGVFKPLTKVELKEGGKAKVTIEKERGIITSEDIKEIKNAVKTLPKSKISLKKLDEIYYEGKMLD
ncbi:MAG: antitoxin family protein [Methanophagales archaeon]|nr:antitoxin family protein [Methanophagales archaeon]